MNIVIHRCVPLQSSQGISIANVHLILHFKVTFVAILWVAIPSVMYVNILSVLTNCLQI